MNKKIKIIRIINILLVILWMITVFNFSKEEGKESSNTSRGITENAVNIATNKKDISNEEKENIIEKVDPIVRKLAHYSLYLIGGFLIMNCLNTYNELGKKKWIYSLIIGMLYACTDEFHQFFVPDRGAKITDIFIDTLGCFTGILIYIGINKIIYEHIRGKKFK